ncbi:MAG: FAD-dependent oxidoreductase [Marinospirillum sp.]|uniref:FAD-dependent oxidoreductase n=1 Tax=Marinospirillum sp. TaxID=2183934 RepID=UPI0019EB1C81|nr:FAD-dependent oxidoreductase [Marinospirillum sp.]MBE0507687.1 FAD-dependent oxidoreductase [Marinospirillum sp.]
MPSVQQDAPLIIVGSGMAGYQLVTELRKLGDMRPIHLLTQDGGEVYSKPLLSTALAKKLSPEQLVSASAEQQAEKLQLQIHTLTQVTGLDTNRHELQLGSQTLSYAQLVLATGAEALLPPLSLPAPDGALLTINDLDDYRRFRQQLQQQPITLLGGGLVGVEMAQDLLNAGYPVTLIARGEHLLQGLIPPPAAKLLETALQQQGLILHKNTSITRITGSAGHWQLYTDQQQTLQASLILAATGLRPRIKLAADAGITTGRGICVNRQLQTSASNVYALGDCAEINGQNLMYVQPLMASARVLAAVLHGDNNAHLQLDALPVLIKTTRCPVVAAPPPQGCRGEWCYEIEEDSVLAEFYGQRAEGETDQLLGFALAGKAVRQKARLTREMPPLLS